MNIHSIITSSICLHLRFCGTGVWQERRTMLPPLLINLIFVADMDRIKASTDEYGKLLIASLDVGYISENVALYSTSVGLASRPRASIKKEELAQILKLRPEQKIILGHTVGYPQ